MATIDADETQRTTSQLHQTRGRQIHRVALVQHQARVIGVAVEMMAKLRKVATARKVDIQVLLFEQIDGDGFLRAATKQIKQDEELTMMDTDLGYATSNP